MNKHCSGDKLLPDKVLEWVINAIDPDAVVQSIVRLKGSTSSTLHHITLYANDKLSDVVVRQFDNEAWVKEEPDLALHEAKSLCLASQVAIMTPQVIAFEQTGDKCGKPVILMTMLEGAVKLKPKNMDKWLNSLAKTLGHIHAVDADSFKWEYYTYNNIKDLKIPEWSSVPNSWEKAIEIAKSPRPSYKACFIHRDYHPTNVLWKGEAINGVVDWVNACRGPAGIDVGHCRVNLAMLYDVKSADVFLSAYQHHTNTTFKYDVYWDIIALIDIMTGPPTVYSGWEAFGVTGLTNKMIEERIDSYVKSLVAYF